MANDAMTSNEMRQPASDMKHSRARQPAEVDLIVGRKLRALRRARGISQTMLADSLEVTFQQVQKYENGTNRISASRLYRAAHILGVPIEEFFHDAPPLDAADQLELITAGLDVPDLRDSPSRRVKSKKRLLELLEVYYGSSESVKRKIRAMIRL